MGPLAIPIAMMAFSAFQAISTQRQAVKAADAQADAARQQHELDAAELTRQQREQNRVAEEEKSDRIRRAEQELAFLQVAGSDAGSGAMTMSRRISEVGFVEGQDISRLEANRAGRVESLESSKKGSQQNAMNVISQSRNEAKAATTNAWLSIGESAVSTIGGMYTGGSGLQIGGKSSVKPSDYTATLNGRSLRS